MTNRPTYSSMLIKNTKQRNHSVFIGTPATGLVRMEWVHARYGQVVPCNWGFKQAIVWMSSYAPMGYLVADAQNVIVERFMKENAEWLLLLEQDNLLPPDGFIRLNEYMRNKNVPIVSGLYFTKSRPSEPILYRGRGNSYFKDWKIGDKVWVDGVPTGCLLIHRSIIETLYKESESYHAGSEIVRRVFNSPQSVWFDPQKGWDVAQGTSDLEFCSRLIVEKTFQKAGWKKYQDIQYPFLVDTNLFVGHINEDGQVFPSDQEKVLWMTEPKQRLKISQPSTRPKTLASASGKK